VEYTLSPELCVDFSFENEKLTLESIRAEILTEVLRYNPGFDIPEELLLPHKFQHIVSDDQSTMMYDSEMGLSGFDSSMSLPMLVTSETNGANSVYDAQHISSGTNSTFRNYSIHKTYPLERCQGGMQIDRKKVDCVEFPTANFCDEKNSEVVDFTSLATLSKPPLGPRPSKSCNSTGIEIIIFEFRFSCFFKKNKF
jgi:hypothetical protein